MFFQLGMMALGGGAVRFVNTRLSWYKVSSRTVRVPQRNLSQQNNGGNNRNTGLPDFLPFFGLSFVGCFYSSQ